MISKKKHRSLVWKRIRVFIGLAGFLFMAAPCSSQAAGIDFNTRITELKAKFPDGKYWNHVGSTKDNSDGYTSKPCTLHKTSGVSHVYGTGGCTCNHFAGGGHLLATQCMGFANKLGYDVFGDTTWITYNSPSKTQIANIQVGDIVRINGSHSVFVIARSGNNIMVAEANYPNGCQIKWGRIINLTTVTVSYYEHAGNYDSVLASGTVVPNPSGNTTEQAATEDKTEEAATAATEAKAPFTGWKKAADGIHYQYIKADKVQKKKWITVKKKKYYLDKKGYRVTGLYKIGKQSYYFNTKGVLQKKKWVTFEGESYYVGGSGYALKKQWLYKGNTLVYVTSDGSMAKSEMVKISGKTYYFNAKGKRSKGFKKYKGNYYYCNSKGVVQKKKWITKGGKKYYLKKSGVRAQSTLMKIGKYKYYFNEKGCLVKNKRFTYKGKIYKADKKGHCKFVKNDVTTEMVTKENNKKETTTEAVTEEAVTQEATTEQAATENLEEATGQRVDS